MLCFVETIVRLKDAFVVSLLHRLLEICEVCYGEGNRFVSIQKNLQHLNDSVERMLLAPQNRTNCKSFCCSVNAANVSCAIHTHKC